MKTGIIDVGGGFRDFYGAGVLDVCLAQGIRFDYCIGISAGSANLISYLSQQPRRSYALTWSTCSARSTPALATGSAPAITSTSITATARSPTAAARTRSTTKRWKKAPPSSTSARARPPRAIRSTSTNRSSPRTATTCSRPPARCRCSASHVIDGKAYLDGGVSDPVPVDKALADGCDRVVLILTRPVGQLRQPGKDRLVAGLLARSCPAAAQRMRMRHKAYNDGVARSRALAAPGRVLIVAPDDIRGLSTLTRDRERLQRLYEKGVSDAGHTEAFLQS